MVKVTFRVKVNGEWQIRESVCNSINDVKEYCKSNPEIADWEIILEEFI